MKPPKISPFIWFEDKAEEAAKFYVSIFPDSKITSTVRYPKAAEGAAGRLAGSVMTVAFELFGQQFTALNGGRVEGFNLPGAISFVVSCQDQTEIDKYWEKLTTGGKPNQCGWLTDKFGVAWQIVPAVLPKMLSDPDEAKVERVTKAFLPMTKFDIAKLEAAYAG